ncbi:MAG: hypothetical protein JWO21_196, partial [Solirubrobacterales bacterium]|nr:hypothetical protein [Solirubrobacterales bacterium]
MTPRFPHRLPARDLRRHPAPRLLAVCCAAATVAAGAPAAA